MASERLIIPLRQRLLMADNWSVFMGLAAVVGLGTGVVLGMIINKNTHNGGAFRWA